MNILITGGCGFIGSNLVRYILENTEHRVFNIDKLTYAGTERNHKDYLYNPNYFFEKIDIKDMEKVDKIFHSFKPDAVMHLAAESHVDRSIDSSNEFIGTNIIGTHVLLEVARNYCDISESRKKSFKFLLVSCYDEVTRAFTRSGFKSYSELVEGEDVLSLNPVNGLVEWKPITKIIVQDYSGDMVCFKNKLQDLMVTPNHRMYYKNRGSDVILVDDADAIKNSTVYIPEGNWEGVHVDTIDVEGIGCVNAEDLMYLNGVYLGDGNKDHQIKKVRSKSGLCKSDRIKIRNDKGHFVKADMSKVPNDVYIESNAYRIFLHVPKNKKGRKRLEDTLNRIGIEWSTHKSGNVIYFGGKDWFNYFEQFSTGALNKQIPENVLSYSKKLLKSLFDGLMDTDGSYVSQKPKSFFTSSPKLWVNFIELAVKLGKHPRYSSRMANSTMKCGRVIKANVPNHIVYLRNGKIKMGRASSSTSQYSGKIWCVSVKDNKNLLVERNGILMFSGNTDEVFGSLNHTDPAFTEKTQYQPNSPYSASKAASDHLVRAWHRTYGMNTLITHCSNNYGPQQLPEKLIPNTIFRAFDLKKIPVYGTGENVRDWIHVEDHCRALLTVLEKGVAGEMYSIGGDNEWNNISLVKKICDSVDTLLKGKEKGKKSISSRQSLIEFVTDRKGHDIRYAIDSSKIRKELGWKPLVEFETGLEETVVWYLNHRDWWL